MSSIRIDRTTSPAGDPAWVVRDYVTVRQLLADERINRFPPKSTDAPARFTTAEILQFRHLSTDGPPPPDDVIRRMVAASFSARRMEAISPAVSAITDGLLTAMRAAGPPADIRRDLADPLSSHVISELLGVPSKDRELIRELSATSVNLSEPERAAQADRDLKDYMRDLVVAKQHDPAEDVLSDMARAQADHPELFSMDLVIALAAGLRFAGQINTVSLIERGILVLLTHREYIPDVRADAASLSQTVEEILRYPHPIQRRIAGLPRYAQQDFAIGGAAIRRGDLVILDIDEANVDAESFNEPSTFAPSRRENSHLSFGYGPHYCVGAALARIELKSVFSTIFDALTNLRLATEIENLQPRSHELSGGVLELPVTWDNV